MGFVYVVSKYNIKYAVRTGVLSKLSEIEKISKGIYFVVYYPCVSLVVMDPRWKHPFTALIAGPTSCGKSHFVKCFIENLNFMIDVSVVEVIWCYSEWQSLYANIKDKRVRFHEGLIDASVIKPNTGARVVIIDDMMREADGRIVDLFSKGSHHRSLSVMFITQNLFHQGKGSRDMSLNSHYVVMFKNPRDRAQISHMSRQVSPQDSKHVQEAFENATQEAHGYLLFDFKQSTPDTHRLRTKIFPTDRCSVVYIPKKVVIKREFLLNL